LRIGLPPLAALALAGLLGGAGAATQTPARDAPVAAAGPQVPGITAIEKAEQQSLTDELAAVRRESVGAAATAQQHERNIAALNGELAALTRDAAKKTRGLERNEAQRGRLLATLQRLARNPPESLAAAAEAPVDQIRGQMLLAAAIPAIEAQARALRGDIEALAAVQNEIRGKQLDLAGMQHDLDDARQWIAQLVARHAQLEERLLPQAAVDPASQRRLAEQASDLGDLIKRAGVDVERRDAKLFGRDQATSAGPGAKPVPTGAAAAATADPARPSGLRPFGGAHDALLLPVSGSIGRRWGQPDELGTPSRGLSLATPGGGTVIAPFDGQVIYAGPFRGYGLVLIIQHGGAYHSVLAGLGRLDARVGEWVVAGEPVGAAPATEGKASGSRLYFELRHDGQPVDPTPLVARNDKNGHDDGGGAGSGRGG